MKKCPICKQHYSQHPAISRRDDKTKICPDCGVREALEDAKKHGLFKEKPTD